ncbi:MAG: RNA 2',3'-cyclic phosphodiesterase [Bdellovibrionaceae bacterium]|nr:RNA 2',3'-cyclic phosphodiesterase [Bdellovibrionales bacterium]MCB9254672.1 RNA 2',3'-cyclic phosphodiesterase [Pseudobdellovibrionaceae bacterium]
MRYQRLFLGVLPQPEIVKDLEAIQQAFSAALEKSGVKSKARAISPLNFHLTLHFIGPATSEGIERFRAGFRAMPPEAPVRQPLDRPVAFPSPTHCRVAGIGGEVSSGLEKLWKSTGLALHQSEIPLESREYRPHVSLMRFNRPTRFPQIEVPALELSCDAFFLFESVSSGRGPKYEIIDEFTLAAPPGP